MNQRIFEHKLHLKPLGREHTCLGVTHLSMFSYSIFLLPSSPFNTNQVPLKIYSCIYLVFNHSTCFQHVMYFLIFNIVWGYWPKYKQTQNQIQIQVNLKYNLNSYQCLNKRNVPKSIFRSQKTKLETKRNIVEIR